ncbi:MAG: pyridoxamine 5'-phosphate oxidase family protein [Candidatus Accumulibacter sp.]|nr:pyridoxamine 5'-phosphate oxidase family protein [Accumulibacter sp.]
MNAILSAETIELINDPETVKVLATVDAKGNPHAVVKKSLHAASDGTIHLLEILEASASQRNLTASLWFERCVAVLLFHGDGRQVQIKGKPVHCHVSGPLFLDHYARLRERLGDVDLSGVWVIEPDEVIDESYAARKDWQQSEHPVFIHLDRIAKPQAEAAA